MRIDLEARATRSATLEIVAPLIALVVSVLIGGVVVALLGKSPQQAFFVYFVDPLSEVWSLQEVAIKAAPLVLIAVGLSFCFRANLWNIGAEGQFVMGGLAGGTIAIVTHGQPEGAVTFWILPLMLAAGLLAGAAYALIPAILRARLGVSEILTSLMLVYVAERTLDYFARGALRDPKGFNFPQSVMFDDVARLPFLMEGERLHIGVLFALMSVALAALVFSRTLFGFDVRLVGSAPKAARFAGFSDARVTYAVFAISGGAAGLAGICEVAGQIGQIQPVISPGYGFTAIIVAFLGRLQPVGILFAGLILSLSTIGGEGAQISMKIPLDMTRAFQGILLMCVLAADVFTRYRVHVIFGRRA
jgi:general nucleoside transport system permease protein